MYCAYHQWSRNQRVTSWNDECINWTPSAPAEKKPGSAKFSKPTVSPYPNESFSGRRWGDRLRDRDLKAKVKGVSLSNACHLIFFICFGFFFCQYLSSSLRAIVLFCFFFFTVFQLFYLLFTFFSLPCFAFLFVCFYFWHLFITCFQACKVSKVATLMSSKLKVRKEIDCYGEEKKITLNKTAPYFSFETVKETLAGLRWWSKPPTIGKNPNIRIFLIVLFCLLFIFFPCRLLIHLYFRAELFKAGFR